jgi:pantetheine-phosphate adenylyltransferase
MSKIGLFPGTFDPMTLGHLDLIKRASGLFDLLIIGIVETKTHPKGSSKTTCLETGLRAQLIETAIQNLPNTHKIKIKIFSGLLVDFAKSEQVNYIVRGLRNGIDLEYEQQLAGINQALSQDLETIFLITDPKYAHISSSLVREVGRLGGDISSFMPKLSSDLYADLSSQIAHELKAV